MALHKIEVGAYPSPYRSNFSSAVLEVVQLYAPSYTPEKVSDKHTYAQTRSFDSSRLLALNMTRPDLIESIKKDLIEHSMEMHFKGYVTVGFAIKVNSSRQFYAVDSFDVSHMKKLVELHQLLPAIPGISNSLEL